MNENETKWVAAKLKTDLQQTIRERLEYKKRMFTEQLATVETALKLLNELPQLEAFHDAITKAGY